MPGTAAAHYESIYNWSFLSDILDFGSGYKGGYKNGTRFLTLLDWTGMELID